MSMVKPITKQVSAFDATQSHIFYFISNGGNQVVSNKIIIKTNDVAQSIVYENKISSFSFQQQVPSNTLTNGKQYVVSFITYDIDNNASAESDGVLFYCFTTPTLEITNIINNKVGSSSYIFNANYNQIENEPIESLIFTIYDSNNIEIGRSGNIYNQPFNYEYSGFEDNKNYSIKVDGLTKYGTNISSDLYKFLVQYEAPELYAELILTNNCEDGYVNISTNLIPIDGETNLEHIEYIDNEFVDLRNYGDYVKWDSGYEIPKNFAMEIWGKVGAFMNSEFFRMGKISFSFIREIPYGQTQAKDCVLVKTDDERLYIKSNYVDLMNGDTNYILWFIKNENNYTLEFNVSGTQTSAITWNSSSNVEYGRLTNLSYENETYPTSNNKRSTKSIDDLFPIKNTMVVNSLYDEVYITKNISTPKYTTARPQWNNDTILDCKFDDNINGGNIDQSLSDIKYIRIKKRKYGTTEWIEAINRKINKLRDIAINIDDHIVPNNTEMQYAMIPILDGDSEGNYVIKEIKTNFLATYISDDEQSFTLYNGIAYGDNSRQRLIGNVQPIGIKYPIIIENSNVNYEQGSVSGMLFGYNFEKTRKVDRQDVVKQYNDFQDFLNNGKAKIIKDWNGNIWLCRISQVTTGTYVASYGNGVIQVSFTWVEQGKWDNEEDLIDNELRIE